VISPTMAFQLLQILPGVVGKLTGKEKDAKILSTILALPGMAAGILGKSSSIGTSTPTEGTGLQIGGLTGKIADQTQQNFSGVLDMMIGSPTNPYNEQANIYNGLYGSLV